MSARLALVTGASAGIGAAFARIYAQHGYDLAVTARRRDRLEALADEMRMRHGAAVYVLPADLADPASPKALLDAIAAQGRVVDALVNNAGYGLTGAYAVSSWDDQRAFIQVMVTAVAELTQRVLPGMLERRFGRIVNVASVAALVPGAPRTGLYGASKAFLLKFSQALHLENAGTGVHVTALCPGYTHSEFHKAAGMTLEGLPDFLWLGADEVAAAGYEAAEANRPVSVPGAPNKAIAALMKVLPDDWAMTLIARRGDPIQSL